MQDLGGIKGQKQNNMLAGMEHKNHIFVMLKLRFHVSTEPARTDRPHCGSRERLFLSGHHRGG